MEREQEDSARLLVIDDEPTYRDYLERYLVRQGYNVKTAANGDEAIAIGLDFEPQVVLADWMLKDRLNGLEVCESLRRQLPDLKILLMTGYPSAEIREQAEAARVFHFLEKPFGLDDLSTSIQQAVDSLETP